MESLCRTLLSGVQILINDVTENTLVLQFSFTSETARPRGINRFGYSFYSSLLKSSILRIFDFESEDLESEFRHTRPTSPHIAHFPGIVCRYARDHSSQKGCEG